jgi:hypothetical protein
MRRPRSALALLIPLSLLAGCTRPATEAEPATPPWFEDVTDKLSLHFVHDAGGQRFEGRYFLPQIMGSGAALFDYDGDGRLDIYLVQNGGPESSSRNRLFHQERDGTFRDVSAGSGLDVAGHGMGVAVGDVNNDGLPDVYVSGYGGGRLFLNNGNGTFTDVTRQAGLDDPLWGTSACFVDYDRDGWLDLVVVHYVDYDPSAPCADAGGRRDYCHPSRFAGTVTRLYRNLGRKDGVRFEDVTVKAGLGSLPGPGLGVVCADFDGDRWPDIFVANDAQANRLWINQRDGTFREEALARGVAYNGMGQAQANMGVALGDVNGDGLLDLFVTHLTEETHTLWVRQRDGRFRDQTMASGLGSPRWRGTGFGTVLADFNHDGALDVVVANGRVQRGPVNPAGDGLGPFWGRYAERNQVFAGDGNGHFRDLSPSNGALCGTPGVWRGLACGDIDGDGALDLLVTSAGGPARLYRNIAPDRGHWLLVRAVDPNLKRDAYGAEVTVIAGQRRWVGLVNPGQSYLCSNDPRVHFGLGKVDKVDGIRVVWPDGFEEEFAGRPVDQVVPLRRGDGSPVKGEVKPVRR